MEALLATLTNMRGRELPNKSQKSHLKGGSSREIDFLKKGEKQANKWVSVWQTGPRGNHGIDKNGVAFIDTIKAGFFYLNMLTCQRAMIKSPH